MDPREQGAGNRGTPVPTYSTFQSALESRCLLVGTSKHVAVVVPLRTAGCPRRVSARSPGTWHRRDYPMWSVANVSSSAGRRCSAGVVRRKATKATVAIPGRVGEQKALRHSVHQKRTRWFRWYMTGTRRPNADGDQVPL